MREFARQLGAICQFLACRRVETGDSAPVTVVADADEAAGLDPARRQVVVSETLGPPRFDSLPDPPDRLPVVLIRACGVHVQEQPPVHVVAGDGQGPWMTLSRLAAVMRLPQPGAL